MIPPDGRPLRTTVIGSYPFPGWLEFALRAPRQLRPRRRRRDAGRRGHRRRARPGRRRARRDHRRRADAARLQPVVLRLPRGHRAGGAPPRRFGPPAHDQRGRHAVIGELAAPRGLGAVEEFQRLQRLAPAGPDAKASVPGPYTLSGRLVPGGRSARPLGRDRGAAADRAGRAGGAGGRRLPEITRRRAVDELLRASRGPARASSTSSTAPSSPSSAGRRLSTHLCFGNYKGRAVGRAATRRCSRRSSTCTSTKSTSRWPAASSPRSR